MPSTASPAGNLFECNPPGDPGGPRSGLSTLTLGETPPREHGRPCLLSFWPGDGGTIQVVDNLAADPSCDARLAAGIVTDVSFNGAVAAPPPHKPCVVIRYRVLNAPSPRDLNAIVVAAGVQVSDGPAVARLELVLSCGDQAVGTVAVPAPGVSAHMLTADRFANVDDDFVLELRIFLAAHAVELKDFRMIVSDCFVGQGFDPCRHHPAFRGKGVAGAVLDRWPAVRDRFVGQARDVNATSILHASQQFIDPVLVPREGHPSFAMLLGTLNSLLWYAFRPRHHHEFFVARGLVRPGDVVLDCGAHAGELTMVFAHAVGPRGRVIAFEPFPQNNIQIEANAALNGLGNVTVAGTGVGAARREIRVSNKHQNLQTHGAIDDGIVVSEVPLDAYVGDAPAFVKMDIEGFEVFALRGAQQLLREHAPRLFIEVHTPQLADFGVTLHDLFAAIPADRYALTVDEDGTWRPYSADMADRIKGPFNLIALPR